VPLESLFNFKLVANQQHLQENQRNLQVCWIHRLAALFSLDAIAKRKLLWFCIRQVTTMTITEFRKEKCVNSLIQKLSLGQKLNYLYRLVLNGQTMNHGTEKNSSSGLKKLKYAIKSVWSYDCTLVFKSVNSQGVDNGVDNITVNYTKLLQHFLLSWNTVTHLVKKINSKQKQTL
jgi:hypothetical protein